MAQYLKFANFPETKNKITLHEFECVGLTYIERSAKQKSSRIYNIQIFVHKSKRLKYP